MSIASVLPRISPKPKAKTSPLAKALAKLEITPFPKEHVEKYKQEHLSREFAALVEMYRHAGFTDEKDLEFKQTYYYPEVRNLLGPRWTNEDRYMMMDCPGGSSYPKCVCMGWHRYSAEERSDIPDFVSRKMAQISAEVPGVSFAADVLESDVRPFDPLLVVKLGDEEEYIEVWGTDERLFSR